MISVDVVSVKVVSHSHSKKARSTGGRLTLLLAECEGMSRAIIIRKSLYTLTLFILKSIAHMLLWRRKKKSVEVTNVQVVVSLMSSKFTA